VSLLLAVDGGSQSTKVTVVDAAGSVRASARVPLRPYELGPGGRAVHPDDDLWDSLVRACRAALDDLRAGGGAAGGGDPVEIGEIGAIGLCGIRFCRALLDAEGRLTEPVLSWMDNRVGRPLDPDPRVATVISAGGYLAVRLTGERRDSAASYAGLWPLDPVTRRWSDDPAELRRTGMPTRLLPELVDPGEVLGTLTREAADALGLPRGVPVVATANDKAVEALGAGLTAPGPLLLSLGTYVAAMTVAAPSDLEPDRGEDRVWLNPAAVPGETLAESAGVRRGMSTVSWVRDLVVAGHDEPVDHDAVLRRLEDAAVGLEPGCDGLFTVPDWLAPGHAPYRRGAVLGLTGAHRAPHLYRSVLEGIALTMRGHVEAMEAALGRRSDEVVVSGGGSRSPLMRQVVADVLGRPARVLVVPDAAGTGAAICAAVATGLHPSWVAAVEAMVSTHPPVLPDPGRVRAYDDVYAAHASLHDHTDPMFQALAQGRNPQDSTTRPPSAR